jgi:hypothetical protein
MEKDWNFENCVATKRENPGNRFRFPDEFINAHERYIIVREARAIIQNAHSPSNSLVGDLLLHATFAKEPYCDKYICIVNDPNMKKKKFKYVFKDQGFQIFFTSFDGLIIEPIDYVFDFLLKWR